MKDWSRSGLARPLIEQNCPLHLCTYLYTMRRVLYTAFSKMFSISSLALPCHAILGYYMLFHSILKLFGGTKSDAFSSKGMKYTHIWKQIALVFLSEDACINPCLCSQHTTFYLDKMWIERNNNVFLRVQKLAKETNVCPPLVLV